MTHILKTLTLSAAMLACASTAHAGPKPKQVEFKYLASDTAEEAYEKFQLQARRACGRMYSAKVKRKCANELIDQVLVKIQSPQLYALHSIETGRKSKTRQYASKHMAPGFVSVP